MSTSMFKQNHNNVLKMASMYLGKDFFMNTTQTRILTQTRMPVIAIAGLFTMGGIIVRKTHNSDIDDPLKIVLSAIKDYLTSYAINHSIHISDFVDPEYPDWQEKRITVKVDAKIKQLYEDIKPNLLKNLQEKLDSKYFENIIIKFETLE